MVNNFLMYILQFYQNQKHPLTILNAKVYLQFWAAITDNT